jgi:hypothetical protein
MKPMADAGEGNEILLTTDHAKSMKTLGSTRKYTARPSRNQTKEGPRMIG